MESATGTVLQELTALLERLIRQDGAYKNLTIPSLCLYRASRPGEVTHSLYRPSLCVIAQGTKEVLVGDEVFRYDPAHYLLASVELPVIG